MDSINLYRSIVAEALKKEDHLVQEPLKYDRNELDPSLSKDTIDYHYGKLAAKYVERYNNKEGDANFNKGGAVLHNIYFAQFKAPAGANSPTGTAEIFIKKHFNSFETLKEEFEKSAMAIQGSGWVFLDRNGKIKTIPNHNITGDPTRIVLLIDWWEHAWALDYQADKAKYLKNIWRIIDWSVINNRLQGE